MNPEILTITENVTLGIGTSISSFDLVTITENFPLSPRLFISVFDTVTLTESWDRSIPGFQMPFSRPQGIV